MQEDEEIREQGVTVSYQIVIYYFISAVDVLFKLCNGSECMAVSVESDFRWFK